MSIRAFEATDIDTLIDIWYRGSIKAHDFIDSSYWRSQREEMKEKYLPMSETYVMTHQSKIIGFISMVDDYLAALFIDVSYQSNGYGKGLLNFAKKQRDEIQLKVYKENSTAVDFYIKNGFVLKKN